MREPVSHGTSHPDQPQAGQTGALGSPGSSSDLGTTGKGLSRYQEPGNQGWRKNRGDAVSYTPHPHPMPFLFKCLTVQRNTSLCGPCPARPHSQGPSLESQPRAQDLELFLRQPVLGGSQASQVGWGWEVCPAPSTWRWCRWASAQMSPGWVGSGCFGGYMVRRRRETPSALGDSGEKSPPLGCTKLSSLNKAAGFNSHPANNLDWTYFIFRRIDLIFLPKPLCSYKVEETLYPLGVFPK